MTQPELFPEAIRRPSLNDKAVRAVALDEMVGLVRDWLSNDGRMDEACEAETREILDDHMWHSNGFEIAKAFDRRGFSVDAELVQLLDDATGAIYQAHARAVREWVTAANPQPKLAIGSPVVTPGPKQADGEIVKIDPRDATYTVFVESLGHVREGMGTHGLIYVWEAVEAINEPVAA